MVARLRGEADGPDCRVLAAATGSLFPGRMFLTTRSPDETERTTGFGTMSARIFSPARTAMQSGKARTGSWVLEYEPEKKKKIDPLMGYTTSSDMRSQIRLVFETKEEAIAYAEKNGIAFRLEPEKEPKRRQISYAENFRYDRKTPWTH
jgi:hypothetical protein